MTRRPTPVHAVPEPPRAAPPVRRALVRGPEVDPHDLPPPDQLMAPEALVDAARGHGAPTQLPIGAMLDASPEALDELEMIASFEDERDSRRGSRAYVQRLEMAVDGALATLDD